MPRTKDRQQQSLIHIKQQIQLKKRKERLFRYTTIACAAILVLLFTATHFIQPTVQTLSGKPIAAIEYSGETPKPWYQLDKDRLSKEGIADMQTFIATISTQTTIDDINLSNYHPTITQLVIYRDHTYEKFTFYVSDLKEQAYIINNTTGFIGEINKRDFIATAPITLYPASDSALMTQFKLLIKALLFGAYISIVTSLSPLLRPLLAQPIKWYKVVAKFFLFSIVLGVFSFSTTFIAGYAHALVGFALIACITLCRIGYERFFLQQRNRSWLEIPVTIAVYFLAFVINYL